MFSRPRRPSAYGYFNGSFVGEKDPIGHVTFDVSGPLTPSISRSWRGVSVVS